MLPKSKLLLEKQGTAPSAVEAETADVGTQAVYNVLRKSFIRQGCDMDSPKAGVLLKNTRIVVLERCVLDNGVIRARYADGWTSEQLKDGSQVLELVSMLSEVTNILHFDLKCLELKNS